MQTTQMRPSVASDLLALEAHVANLLATFSEAITTAVRLTHHVPDDALRSVRRDLSRLAIEAGEVLQPLSGEMELAARVGEDGVAPF